MLWAASLLFPKMGLLNYQVSLGPGRLGAMFVRIVIINLSLQLAILKNTIKNLATKDLISSLGRNFQVTVVRKNLFKF